MAVGCVDRLEEDAADTVSDDSGIVPEQGADAAQDERRKHPRNDSAQLIWLQYFDPTDEFGGREAGRTVNFSGGGMRVTVRTAPPELERVKISYPYCGFQSYAIVRNRFQDGDGIEHLCLEFVDRDFESSATEDVETSSVSQRPKRILFADDDEPFRRIWGSILMRAGYDVVLAEDGQSAVDKATIEKPDIVITDGLMPKLHGFQVCQAVKQLVPQPKVIMLTAVYTSPNYLSAARSRFGADDILTKPCEIADLLSRIEKYTSAPQTHG